MQVLKDVTSTLFSEVTGEGGPFYLSEVYQKNPCQENPKRLLGQYFESLFLKHIARKVFFFHQKDDEKGERERMLTSMIRLLHHFQVRVAII